MSSQRRNYPLIPSLILLRLCLHLRESRDEWLAAVQTQSEEDIALASFYRVGVFHKVLDACYPQLVWQILDDVGVAPRGRKREACQSVFRCAGEATVCLLRLDQSEMMGRKFSGGDFERTSMLELAGHHIDESIQPIARQLAIGSRLGVHARTKENYSESARNLLTTWVAIRFEDGAQQVDACISEEVEFYLQAHQPWGSGQFESKLASADSFPLDFIESVSEKVARLPAVTRVLSM